MSTHLDTQAAGYWDAVKDACGLWHATGEPHYVVSEPATDDQTFWAVPERDLLRDTDTIHCMVGK